MPCSHALALSRVHARKWRTRADLYALLCDVRAQIERDPSSPETLHELGRTAGLSPYRLQRLFRAAYGESPAQLRKRLRLESAAALLRASQAPVGEIARACGFASLPTFSREFRAAFGLAPSRFRKIG